MTWNEIGRIVETDLGFTTDTGIYLEALLRYFWERLDAIEAKLDLLLEG